MLTELDLERRKQKRLDYVISQTVSSSAYSNGNVMGAVMSILESTSQDGLGESNLSSILQSLCVLDGDGQGASLDLFLFNALPTATYTDNTAFAPTVSDMKACIGVVSVSTYVAAGSSKISNIKNIGQVVKQARSAGVGVNTIYVIAVSRGTPTYTQPIQFRFQFSQGL